MGGKGDGGAAAQARADEQARQQRVRQGTEKINSTFDGQFGNDFFNSRQQGFQNYALPQLDTQFDEAKRQLTYSLARSGTLDSSERARQEGVLQREYDTNKRSIADQSLSYGTDARNSIEDARANLIATLNATGDAEQASRSAITRAQALTQPQAYSPIGQVFSAFTNGLGTQAAAERAYAYSGGQTPAPTYNTGLFSGGRAVRVT